MIATLAAWLRTILFMAVFYPLSVPFVLATPFTALMAWMLFDERLAPLALVGMAECVAGVALVNWRTGQT